MMSEDELREILNSAVTDISQTDTNPRTWLSWVVYVLARLEETATIGNPANRDSYLDMLAALQEEIRTRVKTGGWH